MIIKLFFVAFAALLTRGQAPAVAPNQDADPTPQEALKEISKSLEKKDYVQFYQDHCSANIRRQMTAADFAAYMKSKAGKPIHDLFAHVLQAIESGAKEDVLIARESDDGAQFEFILVKVRADQERGSRLWHIELDKEDGTWRLRDTD